MSADHIKLVYYKISVIPIKLSLSDLYFSNNNFNSWIEILCYGARLGSIHQGCIAIVGMTFTLTLTMVADLMSLITDRGYVECGRWEKKEAEMSSSVFYRMTEWMECETGQKKRASFAFVCVWRRKRLQSTAQKIINSTRLEHSDEMRNKQLCFIV
jgi:hypothetical protein